MKLFLKRKILFLISIDLLVFHGLFSQTPEEVITFAAQQADRGNYHTALCEYQRALLFGNEVLHADIYNRMGECFLLTNQPEKAAYYFDLSYTSALYDSLRLEIIYKKTYCLLLQGKFNYALIELYSIPDTLTGDRSQKNDFFLAMTHWGLNDFKQAEYFFLHAADSSDGVKQQKVREMMKKSSRYNSPHPKLALIMSIVCPGSGQLYAGDVKNGVNSLLLVGGLTLLALNTTLKYTFLDAFVSVIPWLQRYYIGGYLRAYRIAIEKRQEKRNKVVREIVRVFEDNQ